MLERLSLVHCFFYSKSTSGIQEELYPVTSLRENDQDKYSQIDDDGGKELETCIFSFLDISSVSEKVICRYSQHSLAFFGLGRLQGMPNINCTSLVMLDSRQ